MLLHLAKLCAAEVVFYLLDLKITVGSGDWGIQDNIFYLLLSVSISTVTVGVLSFVITSMVKIWN